MDEGVPVGVGHEFATAGHEVVYFKDAVKTGSPDELVATAAMANECILVACDKDMKSFAKKVGVSNSKFRNLDLISIQVKSKANAAHRIRAAMNIIELEWSIADQKRARRLHIQIKDSVISTMR